MAEENNTQNTEPAKPEKPNLNDWDKPDNSEEVTLSTFSKSLGDGEDKK